MLFSGVSGRCPGWQQQRSVYDDLSRLYPRGDDRHTEHNGPAVAPTAHDDARPREPSGLLTLLNPPRWSLYQPEPTPTQQLPFSSYNQLYRSVCQRDYLEYGRSLANYNLLRNLQELDGRAKIKESIVDNRADQNINMALTSGKKVCKLDAICAKLKKINKDTTVAVPSKHGAVTGDGEETEEAPADLSMKCLNNNVIGKQDLHNVEEAGTVKDQDENVAVENGYKSETPDKSRLDDLNDAINTAKHVLKSPEDVPQKAIPVQSSRRKSRKAATPRNIAQVRDFYETIDEKDDLANYEINNQNTDFPPAEMEENESEKDMCTSGHDSLSRSNEFADEDSNCSSLNHSKSLDLSKDSKSLDLSKDSKKSVNSSGYDSATGAPLDLSVSKDDGDESMHNDYMSSDMDNDDEYDDDEDNDDDFFNPGRNLVIDEEKSSSSKMPVSRSNSPLENAPESSKEHAAHLKDYAESTMNELISMYGFGSMGHSSDISKQIPMRNFSSIFQQAQAQVQAQTQHLPPSLKGLVQSSNGVQNPNSDLEAAAQLAQSMKGIYSSGTKSEAGVLNKGDGNKLQNDRFTSSSSFIKAVFNNSGQQAGNGQGKTALLPNYSKYLKRYNTGKECGGQHCLDLGYREHYHCIDCAFQVFVKKEEMVRHYKWHKKREESLQHGFLRFSPLDNCTKRFGPCTHNGKQTHYHCLQSTCDKVYISTSDVQMHANYHRKDSAIISEGFQRFRATEDCGSLSCSFYGQRTTHFHCLRSDCRFTFKNKADMEKHKSYHQKDEVLGRDGFKKFMKYEHCMYQGCRYSKVSNHIHCIRSGCDYVLHSTAQLYSHKRKHERRDFENAYKKYRDHHRQPALIQPANPLVQQQQAQQLRQQQQQQQQQQQRHDFGSVQQMQQTINGKPAVQTLPAYTAGMKRVPEPEQVEPLALKKPKLEPSSSDVEMSAPSSPMSSEPLTPLDMSTSIVKSEHGSVDGYASDFSDKSTENLSDEKPNTQVPQSNMASESLNLSGSLSLPIPKPQVKSELTSAMQSHIQKAINLSSVPPQLSAINSNIPGSLSAINSNMPGTLSAINSNMPGTLSGNLVTMMNPGTLMTVPSTGASVALQPPKSVYTERREKDDSWKNYLVRYTANDPCNPRCQYLYKDHYHCKIDGCLVLFKSKDGVREHARFHELQDRITPIAYRAYESADVCPEACQYSEKEKHYHCIWTGCTHVVPYVGPTFGRLEHYRIHEYARAAAGKSYNRSGGKGPGLLEDSTMRRRGRPPKYPKVDLPRIPKVELTDEEIKQSHISETEISAKTKVINGFRVFSPEDPCPDVECVYVGRLHFHCARPRCFTITDRVDVLNLHAKDFHSFVNILEGYEFFDRNVSCRRNHCPNNQTNRHFHCTRPKCDYSFIRHSTMSQHEKKHAYSDGNNPGLATEKTHSPLSPTTFRRDVPLLPSGSVSSALPISSAISSPSASTPASVLSNAANFIPIQNALQSIPLLISPTGTQMSGMPQGSVIIPQGAGAVHAENSVSGPVIPITIPLSTIQALPPSMSNTQLVSGASAPLITAGGAALAASAINNPSITSGATAPLTVLLQRGINQIPQPTWNDLRAKMHYSLTQNCGRPFCKLKKKDHYHCSECNQAFSDPARLRSHIGKHGMKFKRGDQGGCMIRSPVSSLPLDMKVRNSVNTAAEMDPDEAKCLAESPRAADPGSDDGDEELKGSSSLNLNPSTFSQMIYKAQEQHKMSPDLTKSDRGADGEEEDMDVDELQGESRDQQQDQSSRSGRKITKTMRDGFMNSADINLNKQRRGSSPRSMKASAKAGTADGAVNLSQKNSAAVMSRGMKDDSVPDGYSRWRYNEECCYAKCAYRHSVTHFHCQRDDCGYGFSDRSRLVQHTLRHERIDSITGGELQQYRINQDCGSDSCEFNKKMSHFHCKRCIYMCTDSSKVLTHRKHHAKQDSIASQGFHKFSIAEDCGLTTCQYARKQNHYHCLVENCHTSVLGPAQMASHKTKHVVEGSSS